MLEGKDRGLAESNITVSWPGEGRRNTHRSVPNVAGRSESVEHAMTSVALASSGRQEVKG